MGLWGAATPCETDVAKATDEKNTKEEWGLIMEVCDKAGKTPAAAKDYMKAIIKRANNTDPHVAIQAVTLLDACIKNCGMVFHLEIASREFENEYNKLLQKSHPQVNKKLRESLKKWAENEFKSDPQLNLIPSLYNKLRNTGLDFSFEEQPKRTVQLSKDPNVVQSQEEEDQIAKAIELSLKDAGGSSPHNNSSASAYSSNANASSSAGTSSLYPSTNVSAMGAVAAGGSGAVVKEQRKVRALYDFVAAEDNELTFNDGEIIFIIDDSDPNWWKGSNQRGEGLFPANFVTTDLSLDPQQLMEEKKKKIDMLDDSLDKRLDEIKEEVSEIDEAKIDRLLHLLHEADPTNPEYDTKEMLSLEREVNSMGTLIDKELENVDRKHAQLTQLSSDLVEALSLYHSLMREPPISALGGIKQPGYHNFTGGPPPNHMPPPPNHMPPPPHMMFNGNMPPHSQPPPPHPSMFNTIGHDRQFMPPPNAVMIPPNHFNTLPPPNMLPPQAQPPQQQQPPPQHPTQNGPPPPPQHLQQQQQQQQQHQPPAMVPPHMQAPPPQNDPRGFPPQQAFNGAFPGGLNHPNASFTSLPPPGV